MRQGDNRHDNDLGDYLRVGDSLCLEVVLCGESGLHPFDLMMMVMDDCRDECDGGDAAVMIVLVNDGGHCTLVIWKIPSPHSSAPLVFWVRSPVSL